MLAIFSLILFFIFTLQTPELLQLSSQHKCIHNIMQKWFTQQNCNELSQTTKCQLSIKMSNCLLSQMGKQTILCSELNDLSSCDLSTQQWNTFNSFFTHIDNLCHFYWQINQHQRSQSLIQDLTQSATLTQTLLQQHQNGTKQLLQMQKQIRNNINQGIIGQQQIFNIINSSQYKLNNLTNELQYFLTSVHQDLNTHYSSLNSILTAISQTIHQMHTIQQFMMCEIGTINGIIYYLLLIIIVTIICTLKKYRKQYMNCLWIILINFIIELLFHHFIAWFIGVNGIRWIFILILLGWVTFQDQGNTSMNNNNYHCQIKNMQHQLYSYRLNRIVKEALREINQQVCKKEIQ